MLALRPVLAVLLAAVGCSCATGAAGTGRFDFSTYEFAPTDAYGEISNAAAMAHAAADLMRLHPPGSSARAAIADVQRAGAACHADVRRAGTTLCRYARPAQGYSGLVGSSLWRIEIQAASGEDRLIRIGVLRQLDAS